MERTSKLNSTDTSISKQPEIDSKRLDEAVRRWIGRFNAIPQSLVARLIEYGDDIDEITPMNDDDVDHDNYLPIWGTMWSFDDYIDTEWLEDKRNLKAMADCGFRIYIQEDLGYIFGIDGAGYDFYEAHWIPLYEARGLMWHL